MMKQLLKTIIAGALAGLALFMIPLVLIRLLVFILILKAIFRLMGWRRKQHKLHYAHVNGCHRSDSCNTAAFNGEKKWPDQNLHTGDNEIKS